MVYRRTKTLERIELVRRPRVLGDRLHDASHEIARLNERTRPDAEDFSLGSAKVRGDSRLYIPSWTATQDGGDGVVCRNGDVVARQFAESSTERVPLPRQNVAGGVCLLDRR